MDWPLRYGTIYPIELGCAPIKKGVYIGRVYSNKRYTKSVYSFLFKNKSKNPEVYTGSYKNIKDNPDGVINIKSPIKRKLSKLEKEIAREMLIRYMI
jgi:hypothetical protein